MVLFAQLLEEQQALAVLVVLAVVEITTLQVEHPLLQQLGAVVWRQFGAMVVMVQMQELKQVRQAVGGVQINRALLDYLAQARNVS